MKARIEFQVEDYEKQAFFQRARYLNSSLTDYFLDLAKKDLRVALGKAAKEPDPAEEFNLHWEQLGKSEKMVLDVDTKAAIQRFDERKRRGKTQRVKSSNEAENILFGKTKR